MELVHLTDLHFGCEDTAALHAAARYIKDHVPDAVIITGDISKDGKAHEIEAAIAWMRTLAAPVLVTPGNHDVPYHNLWGRIFDPWGRFNRATATGVRTDNWHTPEWSVIPINTARGLQFRTNWAQGAISSGQTRRACAELQRCAPGALRIIATHHPLEWPNDAPIHGKTFSGLRAQSALSDAGAQLFLSGHLHFASARLVKGHSLSITSGTLSQRVRHEPCAFTVIRNPAPHTIEAEVLHVVQGVAETATKRRFELKGLSDVVAPADMAAEAARQPGPVGELPCDATSAETTTTNPSKSSLKAAP